MNNALESEFHMLLFANYKKTDVKGTFYQRARGAVSTRPLFDMPACEPGLGHYKKNHIIWVWEHVFLDRVSPAIS